MVEGGQVGSRVPLCAGIQWEVPGGGSLRGKPELPVLKIGQLLSDLIRGDVGIGQQARTFSISEQKPKPTPTHKHQKNPNPQHSKCWIWKIWPVSVALLNSLLSVLSHNLKWKIGHYCSYLELYQIYRAEFVSFDSFCLFLSSYIKKKKRLWRFLVMILLLKQQQMWFWNKVGVLLHR